MTTCRVMLAMAMVFAATTSALAQSSSGGVYGGYIGSEQWQRDTNQRARERAMNQALGAASGGSRGGCSQLPSGWANLEVTVRFPASYGGYPAWVNTADLLPVTGDLDSFIKTGQAPGALQRPALRAGSDSVISHMCAPAEKDYWVIVDSGRQRVAVGRVTLGPGPGPYRVSLDAPPIGQSGQGAAKDQPQARSSSGPATSAYPPPVSSGGWKPPTVGPGYLAPNNH